MRVVSSLDVESYNVRASFSETFNLRFGVLNH